MKKSSFVSMLLSVVGVLFLGLGMCMCTIKEWNMFSQGIIVGCIGIAIFIIMIFIYRKMEKKNPIRLTKKTILTIILGIFGLLSFGVGMCLVLVFSSMILGVVIGVVGIILLLCLIPLWKGLK